MKLKFLLVQALLIFGCSSVFAQNLVPDSVERKALLAIYNSTDGSNWTLGQRWPLSRINSYPDSALYGVTVQNGDITSISLSSNLKGTIPQELGNLTRLSSLQIYNNPSLTDTLPDLSPLKALTNLYFANNNFQEKIPSWIGGLTSLQSLSIYGDFTGPIPGEISSLRALQNLVLYNLNLSMPGAVPTSIDSLLNLRSLSLQSCSLNPYSFSTKLQGLSFLSSLNLSTNSSLSSSQGEFADSLINLPNLQSLSLESDNIKKLTSHFTHLTYLNSLDLNNNDYSDSTSLSAVVNTLKELNYLNWLSLSTCQISYLPNNFDQLSKLKTLYMAFNPISSAQGIAVLGSLPSLADLYMYNDGLTDLPVSFSNLSTLRTLYLVNNNLQPPPQVIETIPNLDNLYLGSNGITSLPSWFGGKHMSNLKQLDISLNQIALPLPDSMQYLTSLTYLNLSYNKLTGPLPSFFSGYTKLNNINVSNNMLTQPLPDFSSLPSLSYVYMQHNNLSGTVPASLSNNPVRKLWVDLSFNHFDSLASFHSDPSMTLIVNNNRLDFVNILKVTRPIGSYVYIPQDTVVSLMGQPSTVTAYVGDSLRLEAAIDRSTTPASQYQWFKYVDGVNDIPLTQPSALGYIYNDGNFSASEAGQYYYKITNPAAPGLVLVSPKQTIKVAPCRTNAVMNFTYSQYVCAFVFSPPKDSYQCRGVAYHWNFGDNKTSSARNPVHGFKDPGTYTVSLSLTFRCGTACQSDTTIQRQVTYDPLADGNAFKDSLVQIVTEAKQQIISTTATTFSDSWPQQHVDQNLNNANSFFNGTRGVWRNEGNYVYKVPRSQSTPLTISKDGVFSMEQFNYQQADLNAIPNWIKSNTMTQYSPYSYELENHDVLGVYSAALYDYGGHLPSANGVNMRNDEMAFTSFEFLDGNASGNWMVGTRPVPTQSIYSVKSGYNNMAIIDASFDKVADALEVDVNAIRSYYLPRPIFNHFGFFDRITFNNVVYNSYHYIQNDSVVCRQVYPANHKQSVMILKQPPFSGIWTGKIIIKNQLDPIVTPNIDNTIAHCGKSSLSISSPQAFKQGLLHLDSAKSYYINAWVSVNNPNVKIPKLADGLGFDLTIKDRNGNVDTTFSFQPSGPVIEGWQQVKGTFTCPINRAQLEITFKPGSIGHAWYDDLRLHPEKGNMKSYVYDLSDYRLTSTLDEENFASFYFYDKEGNLFLVKKETEKGVKTISENVSHIVKQN